MMSENQKLHAIKYLHQIKESIGSVKDLLEQTSEVTVKHLQDAKMDILTTIHKVKMDGKEDDKEEIKKEIIQHTDEESNK